MKYADLSVKPTSVEVELGRGRTAMCRMLSPVETHAIRRALPEPEAPVVESKNGTPMTSPGGGILRDDGDASYMNADLQWYERFHAVIMAIAMGFETQGGLCWSRASLTDPADGRKSIGVDNAKVAFQDAEANRRAYINAVIADLLGDEHRDGLFTTEELHGAYQNYREISLHELVAGSAEGNSGSASSQGTADKADAGNQD